MHCAMHINLKRTLRNVSLSSIDQKVRRIAFAASNQVQMTQPIPKNLGTACVSIYLHLQLLFV